MQESVVTLIWADHEIGVGVVRTNLIDVMHDRPVRKWASECPFSYRDVFVLEISVLANLNIAGFGNSASAVRSSVFHDVLHIAVSE